MTIYNDFKNLNYNYFEKLYVDYLVQLKILTCDIAANNIKQFEY